jgi:drug/metabolite transporter (DMT)-like permease
MVTAAVAVTEAVLVFCVVPFVSSQFPSPESVCWAAVGGIGGIAGLMALFSGFRKSLFGVVSSVSAVSAGGFSVLAGLLLGERPAGLSVAGIVIAAPAIFCMSRRSGQTSANTADSDQAVAGSAAEQDAPGSAGAPRGGVGGHLAGVGWGLAAGAGFSLLLIGLNRAGSRTDLWPIAIAELAAMLTAISIAAATRQLKLPPAGARGLCVCSGSIATAGTFSYFLATHRGLLAVTAVIYSLYPGGTIVLAWRLLGERLTRVQIIGLCLAAASVVLMALAAVG